MKFSKPLIVTGIISLSLAVTALSITNASGPASKAQSSATDVTQSSSVSTLQDVTSLKEFGLTYQVPVTKSATKISKDNALQIVSNLYPSYASTAKNVVVEYQLVSGNEQNFSDIAKQKNPQLAHDNRLNQTPCYIVTFEGIKRSSKVPFGAKPIELHEYNVIIDANSGEVLFSFTYR
ncbi:hypothetical protein ACFDTO_21510 [Microbacteriaceae bacterium 4G12]